MNDPIYKSRRFWSAIVGIVVLVLSSIIPELEQHLNIIAPSVVTIILILVGGYAGEDIAQAWRQTRTDVQTHVNVTAPSSAAQGIVNAVERNINDAA